jgi:hypothetical protein
VTLLAGVAGEAVAGEALDVADRVLVAVEDLLEGLLPAWGGGRGVVGDVGAEGDQVGGGGCSEGAGVEVDDAVADGEQVGVAVEVVGVEDDLGFGGGEVEHRADAGV